MKHVNSGIETEICRAERTSAFGDATLAAERRRALAGVLRDLGIGPVPGVTIAEAGGATFRVLDAVTPRLITIVVEKACPVCGEVLRAPALHVKRATGALRVHGEPHLDTAGTAGAVGRWLSRPHGCRPAPPHAGPGTGGHRVQPS